MSFTTLAIGPHYPATASRYLFDAFEEVCDDNYIYSDNSAESHNVVRAGPTYNDHYGIDWGHNAVEVDIPLPREMPEWNLPELIDLCTKRHKAPDLVLVAEENYRTAIVPTDKVPVVLLSYDGWPNSFERYDMVRPTKAYTVHPYGVRPHPRDTIAPNWRFLPPAYAPWVHEFFHPLGERYADFVLNATMYGKRPALCEYLKDRFTVLSGLVSTERYVENYNGARTTYHNCCYQEELKYRFFEAAAMGTVNITDLPANPRIFEHVGLVEGIHYLSVPITETGDDPYPAFEDIATQVAAMRNNKNAYIHIARTAYQWVASAHTYWHRAKTILEDLGMYAEAATLYRALDTVRKTI